MIQHPKQTAFNIGPSHWVVARVANWGGFDVLEITAQATVTHSQHRRRAHADAVAEAIAATRIHNLTAEDTR